MSPEAFFTFTSAPLSSRNFTESNFPLVAADVSNVSPSSLILLKSKLFSLVRRRKTSERPRVAANSESEEVFPLGSEVSAPRSIRSLATSPLPASRAQYSGVWVLASSGSSFSLSLPSPSRPLSYTISCLSLLKFRKRKPLMFAP